PNPLPEGEGAANFASPSGRGRRRAAGASRVRALSLLDFFRTAGKLKSVRRQGWVDRGLPDAESVADHTFRAMVMAWALGRMAGLNTDRLLRIMLLHDLPEAEAGDATPYADAFGRASDLADRVPHWRELVSAAQLASAKRGKR